MMKVNQDGSFLFREMAEIVLLEKCPKKSGNKKVNPQKQLEEDKSAAIQRDKAWDQIHH